MTSTFHICGNFEKKRRECRSELRENAPCAATTKCGTHTSVVYALRACICVGASIFVFAYAVKNLIQNAAKRGLILCAYPYGEVFALKTCALTRSTRINEWQGYIRPPVYARENKLACINATFSTLSFFSITKLSATGDR